mmetsp:Transcript_18100/g.38692  ORF Transcript_18100/g.38692 Transcript_18100/m.38692 type:complete len:103 (+) Transcript_18100:268-576(+)
MRRQHKNSTRTPHIPQKVEVHGSPVGVIAGFKRYMASCKRELLLPRLKGCARSEQKRDNSQLSNAPLTQVDASCARGPRNITEKHKTRLLALKDTKKDDAYR